MMMISHADDYIRLNTLDNEDWFGLEDVRKEAMMNVAQRELASMFPEEEIPDEAVFEFANTLAWAYNDTNRLNQQGVASFSVKGLTFTFKDGKRGGKAPSLKDFIPEAVYQMLGKSRRGIVRTIM